MMIGVSAIEYERMIRDASQVKRYRPSQYATALAMIEEAMSEIADYMGRSSVATKLAPRLRYGGVGAPLHNDVEGDIWFEAPYRTAANKQVPTYIRDLTLWIMYNGLQDPLPGASSTSGLAMELRKQKLSDFARSIFINGTEP
jgi:hypothetical protein